MPREISEVPHNEEGLIEKERNPTLSKFDSLMDEYGNAQEECYCWYSYGGGFPSPRNFFPDKRLSRIGDPVWGNRAFWDKEMPEDERLAYLPKVLETLDRDFFDDIDQLVTKIPIGEKNKDGDGWYVSSKDLLYFPEENREAVLKETLKQFEVLSKKSSDIEPKQRTDLEEYYEQIKEMVELANSFSLISTILARAGEKEKAATVLEMAHQANVKLDNRDNQLWYLCRNGGMRGAIDRYCFLALADFASGTDLSDSLDRAEDLAMRPLEDPKASAPFTPLDRLEGLQTIAKIKVVAGLDPWTTLDKLENAPDAWLFKNSFKKNPDDKDKIDPAVGTRDAFKAWLDIRSLLKELKSATKK